MVATKRKSGQTEFAQLIAEAPIERINLSRLHLDPENPRLPTNVPRKDKDILNYIASTTGIEDLVNAIAKNDFFPGEPLIVVPDLKRGEGHYTVVEGNRRLTALRLLQDPDEMKDPSARLRTIVQHADHKPTNIPVVVRKNREEVLPYLGFRHITGVKAWEPLSKARYMKQLMDTLTRSRERPEKRYKEVAEAIGSRPHNVRRNLDALAVYELMEQNDFFGIPDLNENTIKFGTLYTALGDENLASYVGIAQEGANNTPTHPIVNRDALSRTHIRDLSRWMFKKNEDGETILGESRNIAKLGTVVGHAAALRAIKTGSPLDYAYQLTTGVVEDFSALLYSAEQTLREAAGLVATVPYERTARDLAQRLSDYVAQIITTLESKRTRRLP